MGTVWNARATGAWTGSVAVKFLAARAGGAPRLRAAPRARGAGACARLDHPDSWPSTTSGARTSVGYIVMEYVDGRPLSELLPLSVDRALDVARPGRSRRWRTRTAPASSIATSSRRTSSSTPAGAVKVADFGIARLLASGGRVAILASPPKAWLGTPRYMAPEALAGAPPDPRMDVYAVGVVLHEMVTGRRVGREAMPPALDRIVARATALDPRTATGAPRRWRATWSGGAGRRGRSDDLRRTSATGCARPPSCRPWPPRSRSGLSSSP